MTDEPTERGGVITTLMGLEAARDAVHFLATRPLPEVDADKVLDVAIAAYMAAGLEHDQAKTLYAESFDRATDRARDLFAEAVNGGR